ncbi:MAG: AAA domain-containing protein [Clostridium sp.]|nr:AAA domain-containing protein [Clostridium sp.]MCM1547578.1 AAA domain-containing protein [Ruminococcus sp.]
MDIKQIKFNIEMSPRALDELKTLFPKKNCSKYELVRIVLSEDKIFDAIITIAAELVCINITFEGIPLLFKGKLDKNDFQCRSVAKGSAAGGRKIMALFSHKYGERDYSRVNPELKKRLDMWYDYIDIMLKKQRENTYIFTYEGTEKHIDDMRYIRVRGALKANVKNLNVGIADDRGEPSFSFGKADSLENGILAVRTDKSSGIILSEGRTRLAVYDAAALITCRRMKNGLDKLCKGEAVNKRLADFIFDPSAANKELGDNVTLTEENLLMKNMNDEQLAAVEGVLNANDLYLIQGPPGTGKTTVIAEICYQNAVRGLKTLVVSQSNLAVDNAISRVMNHSEVRVLRKGDASRVEDEGLPFVEDNVVRTWIKCVSGSAAEMSDNINSKLETLKKYKSRLPKILRYAEDVIENRRIMEQLESQVFFLKNVLEEADSQREQFLVLINYAYEQEDPEKAYEARESYPSDFYIPNDIYNKMSERFADIESDIAKLAEYEEELKMLNEYTAKFTKQMRFIKKHVSVRRMENTAYEGVFHYIDSNLADDLYGEGEKIVKSIPYGIKSIIFRPKWGLAAAIHYRRAESFIYGIQRKAIRLAEKINAVSENEEFLKNLESFRLSLDELCKDYDTQFYTIKNRYNKMHDEFRSAENDYEYSLSLFREKTSDRFFSAALENISYSKPDLEEIERSVNEHYSRKYEKFIKWQKLLADWRRTINAGNMNYNELKQLYIDNANVIGITCIQSGTADFERNYPSFDVVIIDESSKSTPPDIILPMLKGKKIVLVGDHKQLPPYIDSDAYDEVEETDERLRELMRSSLFEELYESAPSGMRTMLFRQYRMHRDIASLVNGFYVNTDAGRLESPSEAPKAHCCEGEGISAENHVLWYDIKHKPEYYEERHNKSYCNNYEAVCIKNILGMLNRNLTANESHKSVGVITFYDAQVRLLEEKLIRSGFADSLNAVDIRTGTVDRFQGMEEDIIIISFVRNNDAHNIGFAKDSRRINVALSRARELLIIVGCSENFKNSQNAETAEMFGGIYNIINRLGGIKKPSGLEDVVFVPKHYVDRENISGGLYAVDNENEVLDEKKERINVLDSFILKSAREFDGTRLTLRNISNALGIAPVFVKSRAAFLVSNKYISCENGAVKLLENGRKFLERNM